MLRARLLSLLSLLSLLTLLTLLALTGLLSTGLLTLLTTRLILLPSRLALLLTCLLSSLLSGLLAALLTLLGTGLRSRLLPLLTLSTGRLSLLIAALLVLTSSLLTVSLPGAAALRLALGASFGPWLASLLTSLALLLLAALILTLLIAGFHSATQRFKVVSKLARAIERLLQSVTARPLARASFRGLNVFEHFLEIVLDDSLSLTSLIVPAVRDHLVVLPYAIRNTILANRSRRLSQFVACLLPVLTHAASRLIDVPFETCNFIRESLLAFAELLLLFFAPSLTVACKLVDASRYFFLTLQRFFSLLSELLHSLLTARAFRRFKHAPSLFHSIQCSELLSGRIRAALRRGRLR